MTDEERNKMSDNLVDMQNKVCDLIVKKVVEYLQPTADNGYQNLLDILDCDDHALWFQKVFGLGVEVNLVNILENGHLHFQGLNLDSP